LCAVFKTCRNDVLYFNLIKTKLSTSRKKRAECMPDTYFLAGILVFCLVAVPGAAGFSVLAVTVQPAGELGTGIPVTVAFDVHGKSIGLYDQLVIRTDLQRTAWDTRLVTTGEDPQVIPAFQDGNTLTINGAVFNRKPGVQGTVHIQLDGTAPEEPAGKKLLQIRLVGADGSEYAYPSGFDLSMDVPPVATPSPAPARTELVTSLPTTRVPSFGELIAAEPTWPSFGDLIAAEEATTPRVSSHPLAVPENRTLSVPATWTGEPPATASPLDPVLSFGATAGILYAVQRSGSRSLRP
jgi:hypothetical protein